MGSYAAEKSSPPLSCYPTPPLDADGQLITLMGHVEEGGVCLFLGAGCGCPPNNFKQDPVGLKERKAGLFSGLPFS